MPTSPNIASPLLDISEAAAYLRVSRTGLWRLARRGDLRPVRIGARTRYRLADLDAFITRCAVAPRRGGAR